MKKITSFLMVAFMVLVASASARQARVVLHSNTNYEVQIDGRTYNGQGTSTINDLSEGRHTVAVYRVISRGILGIGKKRSQLSFEQFNLRNDDVYIDVNQGGKVRISGDGYNADNKKHNRNGDYNHGKYGKSEGKGRGHKYGHYKNKKGKYAKGNSHPKHNDHDDDDDDGNYERNRRWDNE